MTMKKLSIRCAMASAIILLFSLICADAGQKSEKKPEMKPAMIKHDYAEVNGVRLHYASAGKGKLVMFVHGFPEFWYEWKNQLEQFGTHYQAVAPDMRGY